MTPLESEARAARGSGFPLLPPEPVPGCADCSRFAELIASASEAADWSEMTDLRVLMARHLDGAH